MNIFSSTRAIENYILEGYIIKYNDDKNIFFNKIF